MAERIRIDHGSLESGKQLLNQWEIPQSVKQELLTFLDDLGMGKVNRGKKLSPQRQLKYLHALRAPLEFFNKPTARLALADIEGFERALGSGTICTRLKGKPFAHSTQVDIRMLLKIFLRWSLGPARASALTDWLDTRSRPKTPDFLKETEVEKLYKNCRDAQQKFLIAVLFDSGCRAEEFHNIRYEDIYLPEGKVNFVRIALKEEYSKTLGRTVALYWKFSLEAVKDYLAHRVAEGIKPTDPVFRGTYAASKKLLQRLGQRVLNRPVHYHLFRHSSATFYATQLNRQQLCVRYGWKFSSDMVDVYISRSGMESKELDEKFTQTELSTVQAEITRLEQETRIKSDRMLQMEQSMQQLQKDLDAVSRVLHRIPGVQHLEIALQTKRMSVG